jgi:hypothetical protein
MVYEHHDGAGNARKSSLFRVLELSSPRVVCNTRDHVNPTASDILTHCPFASNRNIPVLSFWSVSVVPGTFDGCNCKEGMYEAV